MSKSKKNKTQEAEKTLLLKLQEGKEYGKKEDIFPVKIFTPLLTK